MRYFVLFILFFLLGNSILAQDKYFTKTGHIYFISHTDAIDIDGNNRQVVSFLDIKTGELIFAVLIKSFEFSLATALEHFNETYLESHKFPKAHFKGKIVELNFLDMNKPGKYEVSVSGMLTLHGVTKEINEKATIVIEKNQIRASANLKVNIDEYGIVVPKIVEERVAKMVDVKIDADYRLYSK